ncbi:MAG: SCP2 sterol-binding domain-containing protein, partial [Myxococcaceae bacterium]
TATIFNAIGAYVKANPDLTKINTVYQFKIKNPDSQWVLDLKKGSVSSGTVEKADCTLELSESDWLDMTSGKADPQKLFMGGKLKITGNVMASQKLEFLKKIDRSEVEKALSGKPVAGAAGTAQSPGASVAPTGPSTGVIFQAIGAYVSSHPELTKLNTVYQFKIKNPDSQWVIDLKKGSVSSGLVEKADCTLELSDADWLDMTSGKADPQKLFMGGKLKITGNVMASQKLEFLKKIDPKEMEAALKSAAPAQAAAAPASSPAAASGGSQNAPKIVSALKDRLQKNPALAKEVNAVVQFKVKDPEFLFVADFVKGDVREGSDKATATITLTDEALTQLAKGEETPQSLYQHGQLRVDGDVLVAHRLGLLKQLI